jgi:hypothetical protein
MAKINVSVQDEKLSKTLIDSIKKYIRKTPENSAKIIFLDELAITGGPLEDKICDAIGKKLISEILK